MRGLVGSMAVLTVLGALAAPAGAAVFTAEASDPVGDASGPPSQDIVRVAVRYDTEGDLAVTMTMAGPVSSAQSLILFDLSRVGCGEPVAGLFGLSDGVVSVLATEAPPGSIDSGRLEVDGSSVTLTAPGSAVRAQGLTCVSASGVAAFTEGAETLPIRDLLLTPLPFDGTPAPPAPPTPPPGGPPPPTDPPPGGSPPGGSPAPPPGSPPPTQQPPAGDRPPAPAPQPPAPIVAAVGQTPPAASPPPTGGSSTPNRPRPRPTPASTIPQACRRLRPGASRNRCIRRQRALARCTKVARAKRASCRAKARRLR